MKYVIIIPDGAADTGLDELKGKTPLEAAKKPHLDKIALQGKCGKVQTIPAGLPPGSDVAIMSLLGNNPLECYTGRAPIEAAAQGISLKPGEWAFRCNLVTITDDLMKDHSAGNITSEEAKTLIEEVKRSHGNVNAAFDASWDITQVLETALKREFAAMNRYKKAAEASTDTELVTLFNNLSAEEASHHKRIEVQFNKVTGVNEREM